MSKAEILENTPLHAHVRLHGDHQTGGGHIKLTYWLDVHLWANSTSLRLDYQFFNLHKGKEKIDIDAIRALFRPKLGNDRATLPARNGASGVGLQNVRDRLHALFGSHQSLELVETDDWVETEITLPFRTAVHE